MSANLGEILSDVGVLLGDPPAEWLSLDERFAALLMMRAKLTESYQLSDNNQVLSCYDMNPQFGNRTQSLPELKKGIPAFVYRETGSDSWQPVRIVNLQNLEQYRNENRSACAFFGNESGEQQVIFTYEPMQRHKIWFDAAGSGEATLEDSCVFPERFNYLLALKTAGFLIPQMKSNCARLAASGNLEISELQLSAWTSLEATLLKEGADWSHLFDTNKNRSRTAQSSGNRKRRFQRFH